MPSRVVDGPHDELLWNKAKEIATSEGMNEKDGDEFWRYVMGIYKKMHPHHRFNKKAELVAHTFVAANYRK